MGNERGGEDAGQFQLTPVASPTLCQKLRIAAQGRANG